MPPGPPYVPQFAGLGLQPTLGVDAPISAVMIALFICSAVINMTIFQKNRRRGHKFILSAVVFGFSMARIAANTMRIVWAGYPTKPSIAIAAGVLTNAGVVLLFIVNLILTSRIVRAYHPNFGWSKPGRYFFHFFYMSVVAMLIMVIVATVYSFYTLDTDALSKIRTVQLFATTYLAVLAFLPIPIIAVIFLVPRKSPLDRFGTGTMRTKIILVLFTAVLLTLGASFRAGTAYYRRPKADPAWFHSKACYYCFNYVIELVCVFTYALSRFDKRFWVPNGCHHPGDYTRLTNHPNGKVDEEAPVPAEQRPVTVDEERQRERQWEEQLQEELEKREPSP